MTHSKRLSLTLLAALAALVAWGQPRMAVSPEVANLGEVVFQVPRKVSFTVTNQGTGPLQILQVIPSCGCTTVEWTRTSIAPGETGEISATYDAKMMGVFQKELEVYTNASDEPVYLPLQGRVVGTVTDYSGVFPVDLGQVRMSTNVIEFDNVNKGDKPVAELRLVNVGRKSYKPQLMHLPSYLTVDYQPEMLAGGRIGKVVLTLDSERLRELGLTQASIYLARYPGDKISEENEVVVSSVLLPDFSQMTAAQLAIAPQLTLSADSVTLKEKGLRKRLTADVTLTNTGRSTLTVHTVQVFGKALDVRLKKSVLAPGESTRMRITADRARLKTKKVSPRVLIISDDPKTPKRVVSVQAPLE